MIFTKLIKYFEGRLSEATQLISAQEKAAVNRAEEVSKILEKEILELKKRDAEMEELLNIDDPIYYLQSFRSVTTVGTFNLPIFTLNPVLTFEDVMKSVSQLGEKLEELCTSEFEKIPKGVTDVQIVPPPLPTIQPSPMKPPTTEPIRGKNLFSMPLVTTEPVRGGGYTFSLSRPLSTPEPRSGGNISSSPTPLPTPGYKFGGNIYSSAMSVPTPDPITGVNTFYKPLFYNN
ncbi:uncharacterized protein Hap1MRO34_007039 [Clarias gariepinus]